jgi:hypothetical protein
MNKLCVWFLLIICSLQAVAIDDTTTPKFPRGKGAELIGELKEGKVYGSLKNMAREQAATMQLIGQSYLHQPREHLLVGNVMVLIGWLGVQKINDPSKIVGFKEPIVSSFMFKPGTEFKGVELPTFGDITTVEQAIQDLEQNKVNLEDLKKARIIKAPIGQTEAINFKNISKGKTVGLEPQEDKALVANETMIGNFLGTENNNVNHADLKSSNYNPINNSGYTTHQLPNFQALDARHPNNARERGSDPIRSEAAILVEMTEEGCTPEHDVLQEQVFITARSKKLQNGQVVDEGVCERTLECYPVKRDYLCDQCVDEINSTDRKAYARYMEYWIDKNSNHHNLGLRIDPVPFEFVERNNGCPYQITGNYASKSSKIGYVNKFGIFKTVEDCRVVTDTPRFPVRTTTNGCPYLHDFIDNVSTIQSRVVFIKNGREHTITSCTPIEEVEHIFTDLDCMPIYHRNNNVIHLARRMIIVDGRQELITHECEPNPTNGINAWANIIGSSEDCINQYLHDFDAGRSYIKKRYFYYDPRAAHEREKIYVTSCIRSNEVLEHQYQHDGAWEHDDEALGSRPKLATYIVHNGVRSQIDGAKIRGNEQLEPYVLEVQEVNNKIFHVYTRVDGSIYKKFVREAS